MVGCHPADESVSPFVISKGMKVSVIKVCSGFCNIGTDGLLLFLGGEDDIRVDALGNGVITCCP